MKKRYLVTFLKFAVPLAIIAWLVTSVDRQNLERLWQQQIDWTLLAGGFALAAASVGLTFVRWYLLVRALDLPFRLADAFRLGFVGYLLNFVGVGSVGGDLFKAFFIAREQPGKRPEAVATVVIDRMVGLFALLLVASGAILLSGVAGTSPVVRAICNMTLLATGLGTIVAALILIPRVSHSRWVVRLSHIPKVGPVLGRLAIAVDIYRRKLPALAVVGAMSLAVHVMFAIALYLLAAAIFERHPTLAEHFIIVPLSLVAGALPFTPAGLGTFELGMQELYRLLPAEEGGDGIIVALAYRLITIVIAAIGVVYYWASRREMGELLKRAENEQAGP
jgi:uncharacterized protein (TIRG00374 family)